MFRTKRDMFIKKEAVIEHFSKPVKSYGRGRIIKSNRDLCYKEAW